MATKKGCGKTPTSMPSKAMTKVAKAVGSLPRFKSKSKTKTKSKA